MATQNTSNQGTKSFDKELVEDVNDFHLPTNSWSHARNAINNSITGDLGKLGNEPSNLSCIKAPYKIIGLIHIEADRWAVFSTDNTDSEIGEFIDNSCTYNKKVNDPCLAFNQTNLIKGQSKATSECTHDIYWDDGLNPSRRMDFNDIPWIQNCVDENNNPPTHPNYPVGCITCTDTTALDCNLIRLARFIKAPCIRLQKGANNGTLPNGSYFVVIAYVIKGQKMTDYFIPSNTQSLFQHDNVAGSLDLIIDSMDTTFDEYELVLVSTVNLNTVARKIGIYSTHQKRVTIDIVNQSLPTVPIELIPIRNPIVDKSDAMFSVGDYLLRTGPTNKFDFNYQPLANQIVSKWVSVEYPSDYYRQGGNNTGYMRDEVYSFFIRWIYDTGDKSPSFHIPGRAPLPSDLVTVATDALGEEIAGGFNYRWVVENTAIPGTIFPANTLAQDGVGVLLQEGYMGYWESTEKYPDNNSIVWDANVALPPYPGTSVADYNLCGNQIRHHRFPDNGLTSNTNHFSSAGGVNKIRIMGVNFENIKPPVDNLGNPIQSVIGYEILRGSRQGNRTVIAKGLINNMFLYTIDGNVTTRTGAYPNYPYNDLRPDKFLSSIVTSQPMCDIFGNSGGPIVQSPISNYSQSLFTFHSPETNFSDPFLSAKELKVYGTVWGATTGKFEYSEKHPEHKVISNMAFIVSALAGLGIAAISMAGRTRITNSGARKGTQPYTLCGTTTPVPAFTGNAGFDVARQVSVLARNALRVSGAEAATLAGPGSAVPGFPGTEISSELFMSVVTAGALLPGVSALNDMPAIDYSVEDTPFKKTGGIGGALAVGALNPTFAYYFAEGTDATIRLIKALLRYRQFALKYNSHCLYDNFVTSTAGQRRRGIEESNYIGPQLTDFGSNIRINNINRSRTVALTTINTLNDPVVLDNSKVILSDAVGTITDDDPTKYHIARTASSHYTALKQRLRNQYGQIDSILQVTIPGCAFDKNKTKTQTAFTGVNTVLFGGDTYVGRFTEKNTMPFFYDWMYDQPNGTGFDYTKYKNVPNPTYWLNAEEFETQDFTSGMQLSWSPGYPPNISNWQSYLPSNRYCLDAFACPGFNFSVKNGYFYLFSSGIRDFFVESEINVDQRDWGERDAEQHYDPYRYTNEKALFDTAIIRSGNFYKYDFSLSVSKSFYNFISWGNTQDRYYNPFLAETCYVYEPNRVIYSLPNQFESRKDNWLFFLPNNYKDFLSRVVNIKSINKNGALIMFDRESPVQFYGVDQLETDTGTKITIGDGGLFSQPLQNIMNSDKSYEYGSCQDRLSVINTPMGLFWISQNQGKIFQLMNGPKEISMTDNKWWFAQYLPYKIIEDFPSFELLDNPVIGVGCQSIYDNENALVYFCKRDFTLRKNIVDTVTYVSKDDFLVNNMLPIKFGDPRYFDDASWTVSYDPKGQSWISWHDWHPNLLIPGKNTFMSVLDNGIWTHNKRCDSYCNYYGIDYPFEVEYLLTTGQQVNTLRSIEYIMEVYKYSSNCHDRFHVLDFNFDEAVVYNTEQVSGLLKLNLTPKNNLPMFLQYPRVNLNDIDILYSKEENKYRFNQFWDVTSDRGEFNPSAQRMIWNTSSNGYVKTLNPNNITYNKQFTERKKFRHYTTSVFLRRKVSGDRKILVMLTNNKNLYSPR